jgi:NAD(P)H-nitrite reductase large subunit
MEKLVVIGNGMAGIGCVEQILKHATPFDITIFGDETHANYNRILLSSVLAGEKIDSLGSRMNSRTGIVVPTMRFCIATPDEK